METPPTPSKLPPKSPPRPWPRRLARRYADMSSNQVKCIAIVSLLSIIFICLVATIIWLSFLPKNMHYSIDNGSIDGYSLANGTLNANLHFQLQADNPNNGFAIYYYGLNATVWYEGTVLSDNSTVPPFHQPSRNKTYVSFDVVARGVRVNETVARGLGAGRDSGAVALLLRLEGKITLKHGGFRIHRGLVVRCKGLKMPFSTSKGQFEKVACHKHVYDH